jgi:hypothetical protein
VDFAEFYVEAQLRGPGPVLTRDDYALTLAGTAGSLSCGGRWRIFLSRHAGGGLVCGNFITVAVPTDKGATAAAVI